MNEKPASQKHRPWPILAIALLLLAGIAAVRQHLHSSSPPADAETEHPSTKDINLTLPSPRDPGARRRPHSPATEEQHRAAIDLTNRLTEALAEHQKAMTAFEATIPDPSHLATVDEANRRPRFSADLTKELQSLDGEQLGTLVQMSQKNLSLDFILGTWMQGQDPGSVPPLMTALDLVDRYPPENFSLTLCNIMPGHHPGPAGAAMAEYVLSHRDRWKGDASDFGGKCLRIILLNCELDPDLRKRIEDLPQDQPLPRH